MIGNASVAGAPATGWLARLARQQRRYLAVDGGAGAQLLASLAGHDPRLVPAASPRHADVLIVVEPISRKLAPAVAEVLRAMPRPARALLIGGEEGMDRFPRADVFRMEDLLTGTRRVVHPSPEAVLEAALDPAHDLELALIDAPALEPTTIPLPRKQEREIATELAVLSLGPIQPWTAGPLRLLVVCDGEQLLSAQVEAGYSHRGIAAAMAEADWQAAADLACDLDPLAPVAGRLAYVLALEVLQGWQAPEPLVRAREAALAEERAQNHLWWLVRFTATRGEYIKTGILYANDRFSWFWVSLTP